MKWTRSLYGKQNTGANLRNAAGQEPVNFGGRGFGQRLGQHAAENVHQRQQRQGRRRADQVDLDYIYIYIYTYMRK